MRFSNNIMIVSSIYLMEKYLFIHNLINIKVPDVTGEPTLIDIHLIKLLFIKI